MKSRRNIRNNRNRSIRISKKVAGMFPNNNTIQGEVALRGEVALSGPVLDDILVEKTEKGISIEELIRLIDLGTDIDARNKKGNTPLHLTLEKGHTEVAKTLIENGAAIDARDKKGNTPLHYALLYGHTEVAMTMIDKGADVNARNRNSRYSYQHTPLHLACIYGHIEVAGALIAKGAAIDARDSNQQTPLLLTAQKDYTDEVKYLIDAKADVNAKDHNGNTPLHWTCRNGNTELSQKLIKNGADMNIQNAQGYTPLNIIDPNDYQQYGFPKDEKVIGENTKRLEKKGIYELIRYNEVRVPIMIIPKGTILFRTIGPGLDDFCGIPKETPNEYCLHKNHNVFFYPYPGYFIPNPKEGRKKFKIFVVEKTLKLVNLIYPSYLSREVRINSNSKYDFLENCNFVEKAFCGNKVGRQYDPCLSREFLEQNKDIAGIIALSGGDTKVHRDNYPALNKYSLFHHDVRGEIGVPELILYPKQNRIMEDTTWDQNDCMKELNNFSYLINDDDYGMEIMTALLDPKGYTINHPSSPFTQETVEKIHVTLYNPLKMYVVWEYLEEKYKKDCTPINWSANSKLTQFQSDINNLNKGLYNTMVTTFRKFKDGNRSGGKRNKTRKKRNKERNKERNKI